MENRPPKEKKVGKAKQSLIQINSVVEVEKSGNGGVKNIKEIIQEHFEDLRNMCFQNKRPIIESTQQIKGNKRILLGTRL